MGKLAFTPETQVNNIAQGNLKLLNHKFAIDQYH